MDALHVVVFLGIVVIFSIYYFWRKRVHRHSDVHDLCICGHNRAMHISLKKLFLKGDDTARKCYKCECLEFILRKVKN